VVRGIKAICGELSAAVVENRLAEVDGGDLARTAQCHSDRESPGEGEEVEAVVSRLNESLDSVSGRPLIEKKASLLTLPRPHEIASPLFSYEEFRGWFVTPQDP